jgi:hypothetical protein
MLGRDKGVYQLLVEGNSGELDVTYVLACFQSRRISL